MSRRISDATPSAFASAARVPASLSGSAVYVTLGSIADGILALVENDLSSTRDASTVTVEGSLTGTDATLPAATTSLAGVMTAADKTKLDGIEAQAEVNLLGTDLTDAIDAALGSTEWRDPPPGNAQSNAVCRVATVADISIGTALVTAQTIDDVVLAENDLVLVGSQTDPSENGIYVVGAVPDRAEAYDEFDELAGLLVSVVEGTTHASTVWLCTSASGGTIDTDPVVFQQTTITPTNLTYTPAASTGSVNSSTGYAAVIPAATTTNAGLLTAADKAKLDGIEALAEVNPTGEEIVSAIDTELEGTAWRDPQAAPDAASVSVDSTGWTALADVTDVQEALDLANTALENMEMSINGLLGLSPILQDVEEQGPITGGVYTTPKDLGSLSSGTTTINVSERAYQTATNDGAFTLDVDDTRQGSCVLFLTNGASAGAVDLSAFTVHPSSDDIETDEGDVYRIGLEVVGSVKIAFVWRVAAGE